jgi:hypothetical protein
MEVKTDYFEIVATNEIIVKSNAQKRIDIFSQDNHSILKTFETSFEGGGERIAISSNSKILVSGSFFEGVEAFDIGSGKCIWKNKKAKQAQKIHISFDAKFVFILTETGKLYVLDAMNGALINQIKGVKNIFFDNRDSLVIQNGQKLSHYNNGILEFFYKGDGIFLSVYYDKITSVISEAHKPLKQIKNSTRELIWESDLSPGYSVHLISQVSNLKFAILAKYLSAAGVENYLIIINSKTGMVENKIELSLEALNFCFSADSQFLFCSNGEKIQL